MQQRRCLNDELVRAASVEDVVRDAAITEFIAPPPEPALRLVTQFDFAPRIHGERINHSFAHILLKVCFYHFCSTL